MSYSGLLGWGAAKEKCGYDIGLPVLSSEEEEVVLEVSERFKEMSKSPAIGEAADAKEKIQSLILEYCGENGITADSEQEKYLSECAYLNCIGFALLEKPLKDPAVEEVAVIGLGKPVYVYARGKGWLRTNGYFTKQEVVIDLINKMGRGIGRRITMQSPRLNAVLPDGSRLHASIPPVSGTELTIRKFRENPMTAPELALLKTYSSEALAFLWVLMQSDLSIIIAGNTASGKTTTLNALFSFVPLAERVLITEETPEINIPHVHAVKLLANDELGITMGSLVADSLRMRPDRVIVGEVRTPSEVSALVETVLSGQARGSYATFHAQSAKECVRRMASLGVLEADLRSIDAIVVQRRMLRYGAKERITHEIRRCTEICEIDKENPLLAVPLFTYDYARDALVPCHSGSRLLERICRSMNLTRKELDEEIGKRARFIESENRKKAIPDFRDSVAAIQKFAYGGNG